MNIYWLCIPQKMSNQFRAVTLNDMSFLPIAIGIDWLFQFIRIPQSQFYRLQKLKEKDLPKFIS